MTELESDYVPHTDDVCDSYVYKAIIGPPAMAVDYEEARAQFDRWLAREKAAAVRAIADGLGPDRPGAGAVSTVDDAIEAAEEAEDALAPWDWDNAEPAFTRQGRQRLAVQTHLAAAWPVLSAGLRERHQRWDQGEGWVVCMHCNDNTSLPRKKQWPCETITELDRIDRELGIDHQSGDTESGVDHG